MTGSWPARRPGKTSVPDATHDVKIKVMRAYAQDLKLACKEGRQSVHATQQPLRVHMIGVFIVAP